MTTCERYRSWMVEALYGELDDARRAEFDAHVGECADCAALYSELRSTGDLMNRRRRPDPGPEFWDGYWRRLEQRVARDDSVLVDASRFARWRSLGSWGYRVAAVVAVLAAGVWIGRTVLAPAPGSNAPQVAVNGSQRDSISSDDGAHESATSPDAPDAGETEIAGDDREGTHPPIDAPPGAVEARSRGPEAGAQAVLASGRDDAQQYIERSQLLLLAVLNGDPADSVAFDVQRQRAVELVRVASSVREGSDDRRVRELVAQLELILREIAHLEQSSDVGAVELIRSRVDHEGVLLRINVEQMRSETTRATGGAID
jgi:hypothetical protein